MNRRLVSILEASPLWIAGGEVCYSFWRASRCSGGAHILPSVPQFVLTLALAISFVHFLQGGARTFVPPDDPEDGGAGLGQLSFVSGALVALFAGVYFRTDLRNHIAAAVILVCGVGLYEWARQTIMGRRFYIGLTEAVPEEVCASGPYAYVRHPIYMGYMITFLALFVAFPKIVTAIALAMNAALFAYMAADDERVLARSPLAADYEVYKKRVGRFLPRPALRRS
jgi:protein-S-isoprenylcysteine O-methyltransferase Ste14